MQEMQETQVHSWVRTILWSRKWQSIQVFLPENPMDRGAWQATVHGVSKSQRQLSMSRSKQNALLTWIS